LSLPSSHCPVAGQGWAVRAARRDALAEAEALSDRVTIIRHGKTVETGTLADMRHLTRVSVEAELSAPATLDGMPGVHELTVTRTVVRCQVDHAALDEVVGRLHQAGSGL
jgi:ABC-2 type transport system ATP-binding protein